MVVSEQVVWLLLLALPVACVSWTVTHEEIFREPREWLSEKSRTCHTWYQRKACYVWTCEYCFSHWVGAAFVAFTGFQMLLHDWRGYVLAWFAVVAVANVYMSAYNRLRVEIRKERAVADKERAVADRFESKPQEMSQPEPIREAPEPVRDRRAQADVRDHLAVMSGTDAPH
jgi:hypothetical protein